MLLMPVGGSVVAAICLPVQSAATAVFKAQILIVGVATWDRTNSRHKWIAGLLCSRLGMT
jgi:hypothetical protein